MADEQAGSSAYRRILFADPCSFCGADAEEIDHIIGRKRGGPDGDDGNATAICSLCNRQKRDKSLLGFLSWRLVAGDPLGVGISLWMIKSVLRDALDAIEEAGLCR